MRRLVPLAFLFAALALLASPSASAFEGRECHGREFGVDAQACLEDRRLGGEPSCTEDGSFYVARTDTSGDAAGFLAAWWVGGRESCSHSGTSESSVAGWYAQVGVAGTTWGGGWREYETREGNVTTSSDCDLFVEVASQMHELGCPAGPPPNPGWGDLVP